MPTPIKVPAIGESIKTATLLSWYKNDGDAFKIDEPVCSLETDKANVDITAPVAGVLRRLKKEGDTVSVDEVIGEIDDKGTAAAPPPAAAAKAGKAEKPVEKSAAKPATPAPAARGVSEESAMEDFSPAVRRLLQDNKLDPKQIPTSGPSGRLTKDDVEKFLSRRTPVPPPAAPAKPPLAPPAASASPASTVRPAAPTAPAAPEALNFDANGIYRSPMSKLRKRIAQNLLQAQQTAAILTTFNEVDMSAVIELRARYKDKFQEMYGVGLGFMSFFSRAVVVALRDYPRINAFIDGDDIVYHQHVHMGIAVSTERGLTVAVMRNAQRLGFADIEKEIKRLATAVKDGKLLPDELTGGTFTITNGGIFGSLLSTPILYPPQSGILGMHAIQKRPVAINDKVEIRPMMYVALSYDHRLVDGKESVSFLVRLKQLLEDPARLILEI